MDKNEELEYLGGFTISQKMLTVAKQNKKKHVFLNAGRGNPNWINKKARLAFNRLVDFGILESERTIRQGDLVGYVEKNGISERFQRFLKPQQHPSDQFLQTVLSYTQTELQLESDELVKELCDGVLGNNYPVPSRVLKNTEIILNHYLESTLYHGKKLAQTTDLFPTEGGTAAIVYLFHSLVENKLIKAGDKIAINTPIFTPYLQIPALNDYEFVQVDLQSTQENDWQIAPDEVAKLDDPAIKAFFIVNPSNPASYAFNDSALQAIRNLCKKRPDLMIITDDVYGTFVKDFQSVYSIAPYNTLLVYSFSKLYGATGWRLGLMAVNEKNVFDRAIARLTPQQKTELAIRYGSVTTEPEKMKFIDRVVADSRSVGLYHTAGLSTPQQIMSVLFALTHLIAGKEDNYIATACQLVATRYHNLHQALGLTSDESPQNAKYYTLIDLYHLAETRYGTDFRDYLIQRFKPLDFLYDLAQKNGVVLMDGVGFNTSPGELRVSEANLPTEDYALIGEQVLELLAEYHQNYQNTKK